ncbi:metallothionein [Myxococcaceae bacterium JPH2]|nr:metallothionein [Myxococcaceae bacterium JPH2]
MTRIAAVLTAGLLAGGLLGAPSRADACEAHAKAAATATEPASPEAKPAEKSEAARPLDAVDQLLSAKCSCGSKADCTCKKGACECSKCKGRHPTRQVMDALRGRTPEPKLQDARYDASAGIFI